jgi:hypothetical protein
MIKIKKKRKMFSYIYIYIYMYDTDALEIYISERNPKTVGEIVGICFGILFGSMLIFVLLWFIGSGYFDPYDDADRVFIILGILLGILFYIGTIVGLWYLPYRTRKNIINGRKGIRYLSTAQQFAIILGVLGVMVGLWNIRTSNDQYY